MQLKTFYSENPKKMGQVDLRGSVCDVKDVRWFQVRVGRWRKDEQKHFSVRALHVAFRVHVGE